MDNHTATEQAYKNGYERGSKEMAEKIYKMGEEFYKMTYHKSNALPRLLEWMKDTFSVEIKE